MGLPVVAVTVAQEHRVSFFDRLTFANETGNRALRAAPGSARHIIEWRVEALLMVPAGGGDTAVRATSVWMGEVT